MIPFWARGDVPPPSARALYAAIAIQAVLNALLIAAVLLRL